MSAPAGFGKSTLVTEWLAGDPADGRSLAWLSLDAADNDAATFWRYVVTAFQGALGGAGSGALELIGSSPLPTDLVLTTLLNELAAAPGDVWLVLDDFHLVDSPEISHAMTSLLTHLPPHVHVVLSTRADPDLPLARWRAHGELVEIRAADLRFTLDEAAEYLNTVTGLHLTARDVEVLEERTEGWIAALQLAALSIRGRADVGGFIAQFAGTDRYLVDYLVEEVLAQQEQAVREFLLRTAVLDRLTGTLCDAVVGGDDGRDMLTTLERANLFLVALDDQREWFRYHHLFADVLRARLLAEQPDLVPLLHQRASRWYEAHDLADEAVRHALAARDVVRAAFLMELAVPAIRRDRREATLLSWLEELPDDVVRRSPVLGVFYGYMLMVSGDLDGFELRLDDAERTLAAAPAGSDPRWAQTEELRTLPATVAVYRASIAQARGDLAGTAEHARRALALAGPDDHLARGGAAGFLGLVAWAQGDVSSALTTFAQAVSSLHASSNLVDELSSTVVLADMWRAAGRPSTARRLCLRALQVSEAHGGSVVRATPDVHVGLSELEHEVGDLAAARAHLERAAALGEGAAMTEGRYRWFAAMARVADAEGDPHEALRLLDTAERLYRPGFVPDLRPVAAARARIWIAHGMLAEAAAWARERGVSATDEATYLHEFDLLTLARLLIARHRGQPDSDALDEVLDLVSRLHEAADASGRAGSLVEIRMLSALAHHARGDRVQALEALRHSWAGAPEPAAYARLYLDEGEPMRELLRAAGTDGPAREHARRLLGLDTAADPGSGRTRATLGPPPAEQLSDRELQVLRLLDSDLTGPQIARELFVTLNTLRSHTKRIFTKLDVTTRRAAVRRARERGLT
ncbi:helix-turn-helix transcriptional regulator [Cellulomonas chitinilytica]|uniref:Helix-turn-helix transcriptional regulator n=1 Tax=Cellulomonas chitinilytica TaxID=398759 RepID=A0A919U181_9CELL|nr:LuxR C-terminal-related transcriptional regulator [Cellulomonas chitinilytica]GIG21126.1 helix-turn-helix transcriptional regulator [Cellulomonas chitinilytica]